MATQSRRSKAVLRNRSAAARSTSAIDSVLVKVGRGARPRFNERRNGGKPVMADEACFEAWGLAALAPVDVFRHWLIRVVHKQAYFRVLSDPLGRLRTTRPGLHITEDGLNRFEIDGLY